MKPIINISLTLFLLGLPSTQAFLNIEALRQTKMIKSFVGSSRLMLSERRGNVNKTNIKLNSLVRFQYGNHNYLGLVDYQYGESLSTLDNRQGHFHLRYNYKLNENTDLESFQQTQFNKFQNLTARFLFGLGVRRSLLDKGNFSLFGGLGLFYEKENLEAQPNIDNPRGNAYFSLLWSKKKKYSVSSTFYYQPNIESFSDYRVKFNLGIETIFEGRFTQTIEYSLSRDTRTPVGIANTDSRINAGIGYRY